MSEEKEQDIYELWFSDAGIELQTSCLIQHIDGSKTVGIYIKNDGNLTLELDELKEAVAYLELDLKMHKSFGNID